MATEMNVAPDVPPKVDELLDRLRKVRRTGEGWTALRPAHESQIDAVLST